eukprot:TRINITY_DN133_c0_g1_i1.p3 TRINITY_DN133_c0_g1~~TRINITY_DN133_c0_g1_i1.p3  ORF type:complete len:229 (+),score=45.74 TRINITY_DN133_c0_g1_i1:294-980(+)
MKKASTAASRMQGVLTQLSVVAGRGRSFTETEDNSPPAAAAAARRAGLSPSFSGIGARLRGPPSFVSSPAGSPAGAGVPPTAGAAALPAGFGSMDWASSPSSPPSAPRLALTTHVNTVAALSKLANSFSSGGPRAHGRGTGPKAGPRLSPSGFSFDIGSSSPLGGTRGLSPFDASSHQPASPASPFRRQGGASPAVRTTAGLSPANTTASASTAGVATRKRNPGNVRR